MIIEKGYSISSLSKEINISNGHMSLIVNGKRNPSPALAKKISEILQVEWDDIFFIKSDC